MPIRRFAEREWLNLNETDHIMNRLAFDAWKEGQQPYSIEVDVSPYGGFFARIVDHAGVTVWKSVSRHSIRYTKSYAEGMAALYRFLGQRKVAGMADPETQIGYGIAERRRKAADG